IRLNPEVVGSDLRDLDGALARQDWERAVGGYPGPFLDGFHIADAPEFERWAGEKRYEIAAAVAGAYEALARTAAARSDHLAAAGWWRRRVGLDSLDARLALRLMESLAAGGDRAGAIRHAAIHSELLRGELNAPPDPAVERLAASLKREAGGGTAVLPPGSPGPAVPVAPSVSLPTQPPPARRRSHRFVVGSAIAVLIVAAALLGGPGSPAVSRPVGKVVIGSFEGTDSSLVLAVREAFRAELAREASLHVVSEYQIAEALWLMKLPAGTPLRGPVAEDAAARLGASYALTGTATPLGLGVLLAIYVADPSTRTTILAMSARPERREDVIGEVGRLSRAVRVRLGALPVDTSTRSLPAVTTSSLGALEQYVLARRALSRGDRLTAITLGEGALAQDSLFVLGHYLVGDLLWFTDQQGHSEAHLRRAQALADLAPVRERFLVRARYMQLVADRPDSALSYYLQLRAAYPDEVLAYEGMAWTLRALGEHRAAAAVADTALSLGAGVVPTLNNRLYALISVGDTAAALAATSAFAEVAPGAYREARYLTALLRRDWSGALAIVDRELLDSTVAGSRDFPYLYRRHAPLLAQGRLAEGRKVMEEILALVPAPQSASRVLILQALAEQGEGDRRLAARLAWRAKALVDEADLSAAALARLYERLAILGAWLGDAALIDSVQVAVDRRDAGRGLRSFVLVRETVAGAALLLKGRSPEAAGHLAAARRENFFGRSISSLGMLEADALAQGGARVPAATLYRAIEGFHIPDTDFEVWPVLSRLASRRLASLGVPGS
ncbi:MAG TPA: bacterial transcriptional activator domain-containing protein, partial [Gemmatimonadales bacterium]|nr:bacterial transcriptional activator domain-containing protein [Gemmatimonadales bacterium]